MCDLEEFKTMSNKRQFFFELASNGIIFYIKGLGPASVILAPLPIIDVDNLTLTLNNEGCTIKNAYSDVLQVVENHSLLSSSEYRKFWISWSTVKVMFGKGSDMFPIFQTDLGLHLINIKFVSFDSYQEVSWKFNLPPQLEIPRIQKIQGGKPHWVTMEDQLPDNAFIGGHENEMLYIMRSSNGDSLVPGKFVPSKKKGFISNQGTVHVKNNFEILCGYDLIWLPLRKSRIPAGAVEGGYDNVSGILYVGCAFVEGHLIPGAVSSNGNCIIAYQGQQIIKLECYILVQPYACKRIPVVRRGLYDFDEEDFPLNSHDTDFSYDYSD